MKINITIALSVFLNALASWLFIAPLARAENTKLPPTTMGASSPVNSSDQKLKEDIREPLIPNRVRPRKILLATAAAMVPGKVIVKLPPSNLTPTSNKLNPATKVQPPAIALKKIAQNADFVDGESSSVNSYGDSRASRGRAIDTTNDFADDSSNDFADEPARDARNSKPSPNSNSSSATEPSHLNVNSNSAQANSNPKSPFPEVPVLKANEFAIFVGDNYQIFQTKQYQGLDLDLSCFKAGAPDCIAYKVGKIRVKEVIPFTDGEFHPAATLCQRLAGRSLIAFDSKKRAYNFCRFSDGSMVDSWSAYNQSFPVPKIR